MTSLSRARLFATPWTVVCKTPLSMEFSRQEYWTVLPFPSPGGLPESRAEPTSPESPALQADSLSTEPSWWLKKCLPAIWETWFQSLGRKDPLVKEMATQSSTLAWKIPWMEEPGRLQFMGLQSWIRLRDFTFFSFTFYVGS